MTGITPVLGNSRESFRPTRNSFALFGHGVHLIALLTITLEAAHQIQTHLSAGVGVSTLVNVCSRKQT